LIALYSLFLCHKFQEFEMIKATIAIIDLIIVAILAVFIFKGYKDGFVAEFRRIFSTTAGLILAFRYMSDLATAIYGIVDVSPIFVTVLSFIFIFTSITLGLNYLFKKFLTVIKFSIVLGNLDRFLGLALGLAKGSIVVGLICALLSLVTFSGALREEINSSQLFNPMRNVLPLAYSVAKLIFQNKYKPLFQELDESFSGQPEERKGEAQDLIDYYRYQ